MLNGRAYSPAFELLLRRSSRDLCQPVKSFWWSVCRCARHTIKIWVRSGQNVGVMDGCVEARADEYDQKTIIEKKWSKRRSVTCAGDVWEGRYSFLFLFCRVGLLPLRGGRLEGSLPFCCGSESSPWPNTSLRLTQAVSLMQLFISYPRLSTWLFGSTQAARGGSGW